VRLVVDSFAYVTWLVVDYFAYVAQLVAWLVVDYFASRCSSSTTSPMLRVRAPRHVARLVI
jgi:hypothetical protein